MNRNQAGFSPVTTQTPRVLDARMVQGWFADPAAVAHYARAAAAVGLWRSEEAVFGQVFDRGGRILDVGCGAGRIALGLWRRGFRGVVGIDYCSPMIDEARALASDLGAKIEYLVADVLRLPLSDATFGGAVFGFNGLMQIPGRATRRRALAEIRRIVQPGGRLVFTTHDRDLSAGRAFWREERDRWNSAMQDARLPEYGDRVLHRPEGTIFMHLPVRAEIIEDLAVTEWTHRFDELRSRLANESAAVREFSDECRFWIAEA